MLSSRMAGTGSLTPNCSASRTPKLWRRGFLRSRGSWNMAYSLVWRGLLLSPLQTGCASSSGPNLQKHGGSAPMIARISLSHVMAALIALAAIGLAGTAKSQGVPPPPQVSPGQLALASQIVEIKGAKAMFAPLVHG